MLYTKFQPNISSDSGGKVHFSSLATFSNSGHFRFPTSLNFILLMLHVNLRTMGSVVSKNKSFARVTVNFARVEVNFQMVTVT